MPDAKLVRGWEVSWQQGCAAGLAWPWWPNSVWEERLFWCLHVLF